MKTTLLAAGLLCANLALAADTGPTGVSPAPLSPSPSVTRWADRCTDLTTSGWAFKAPRNFLQWLEVFSDPGIWLEFGRRGLDPQSYVRSLSTLLDPGTPKNFLEWTDPEIYDKWARAAAEPDFYTAVDAILFDPGRLMRWVMLPTDARSWNLLATALSPDTLGKWLSAPFHPKTQDLIKKALDPETALKWSQALANPENYPALKATRIPISGGKRRNLYLKTSGIPEQKTF
ncbi:MAG: hypothetical protein PHD37_11175 [Gallionellaceae bacterium]|nr:hypothetical protein [Gallionellaceae bacterium]